MSVRYVPRTYAEESFPQRSLRVAIRFLEAGARCGSIDDMDNWLAQPQIVNYAFAAEVAIKGLHELHLGKRAHGHELAALFDKLPEGIRGQLRGSKAAGTFDAKLALVSNAFKKWRYVHQEANQHRVLIFFIRDFARQSIEVLNISLNNGTMKS